MPKSKSRFKTKNTRRTNKSGSPASRRPMKGPAGRPLMSGEELARAMFVRQPRIWTVPTAIGLPTDEIETRRLNQSSDLWEFPIDKCVKVRPHNPAVLAGYESDQISLAIDSGKRGEVLEAISDHTRETLIECSPGIKRVEEAFAELFSHGDIDIKASTIDLVEWLDEMYLGTWADPSWAVGVFLRDIPGTYGISDVVRKTAYERLYSYLPVRELTLANGRVIVSLEKPVSNHERFLINQYMIHNQIPEVFQL